MSLIDVRSVKLICKDGKQCSQKQRWSSTTTTQYSGEDFKSKRKAIETALKIIYNAILKLQVIPDMWRHSYKWCVTKDREKPMSINNCVCWILKVLTLRDLLKYRVGPKQREV